MKKKIVILGIWAAVFAAFIAILLSRQNLPTHPLTFVSAETGRAVTLSGIHRLGRELDTLAHQRAVAEALSLAGLPGAEELFAALAAELGADIRKADALSAIGIDASRDAVLFSNEKGNHGMKGKEIVAALPVSDEGKAWSWLDERAQTLFSALPKEAQQSKSDTAIKEYAAAGGAPQLSAALRDGYLYLAPAPNGTERLEDAFATAPKDSIAGDVRAALGRKSLKNPTLFGWAKIFGVSAALGLDFSKMTPSLSAEFTALDDGEGAQTAGHSQRIARQLLRALASMSAFQKPDAELVGRLNPQASVLAQSGAAPDEMLQIFKLIFPQLFHGTNALLSPLNLSADDLVHELEPGAALTLSIARSGKAASIAASRRALRLTDFLEAFDTELLLRVHSPERAARLIDRAARLSTALGFTLERFNAEGERLDTSDASSPVSAILSSVAAVLTGQKDKDPDDKSGGADPKKLPARWILTPRGTAASLTASLTGKTLLLAAGEKHVYEGLSARTASPSDSQSAAVKALGESGAALVIDLGRLIESIRAIPESAYGLGGFAIKATVDRWLIAFDGLQILSLTASGDGRSLRLTAALSMAERTASAPGAQDGSAP